MQVHILFHRPHEDLSRGLRRDSRDILDQIPLFVKDLRHNFGAEMVRTIVLEGGLVSFAQALVAVVGFGVADQFGHLEISHDHILSKLQPRLMGLLQVFNQVVLPILYALFQGLQAKLLIFAIVMNMGL